LDHPEHQLPLNGIFNFTNAATAKASFYRTILIQ